MRTGSALIIASATIQGASATFGWRALKGFSVPGNTINICTPDQVKGFDWEDLAEGVVEKYKGFNFKGCKIFGSKKRDLEARTFGKFLHADVEIDNYINEISSDKGFSIGSFGLSSDDYDGDLDFEFGGYEGDEGRTCNKKIRVGKKEIDFKNDQCGGAKTVKVKIPKGGLKSKCKLKIKTIKFECNTKTKEIPVPTSTLPYSFTVPAAETTPAADCGELPSKCQGLGALLPECQRPPHCPPAVPSIDISIPFPTLPTISIPIPTGELPIPSIDLPELPFPTLPSLSLPPFPTFPVPTGGIPDFSIPIPDLPDFSLPIPSIPLPSLEVPLPSAEVPEVPVPTAEVLVPTAEVPVPTAEAPVPSAEVPEVPVPTAPAPEVSVEVPSPTEPTYGEEAPSSMADNVSTPAPSVEVPVPSLPALPAPEYPETLPKCLNTWLYITECTDSANVECFCPNSEFVTKVQECLESWGKDEADASKAVEFFVGLCNPYISENPAITSAIPTGITFPPAPSGVPCQTITRTIVNTIVQSDAPSSMADNTQPAPTVPAEEVEVPVPSVTGAPEEPVEEPAEEPVTYITEELTETLTIPQVTLVVTSSDAEMIYSPAEPTPAPEPASSLAEVPVPTTLVASTIPVPTGNASEALETFVPGAGSAVTPATMLTIAAVAVALVLQL